MSADNSAIIKQRVITIANIDPAAISKLDMASTKAAYYALQDEIGIDGMTKYASLYESLTEAEHLAILTTHPSLLSSEMKVLDIIELAETYLYLSIFVIKLSKIRNDTVALTRLTAENGSSLTVSEIDELLTKADYYESQAADYAAKINFDTLEMEDTNTDGVFLYISKTYEYDKDGNIIVDEEPIEEEVV